MKLAILGCGLIGTKRAVASLADKNLHIVAAADLIFDKAKAITDKFGGKPSTRWEDIMNSDADIVVIAVYHDNLANFALEALKAGKHVLVEKPGAKTPEELEPALKLSHEKNLKVKVGFNHRYHPAVLKAKEIADSGQLGKLYYVRAWYGHGGRLGYEKEWRFNKEISGGGELLDQGSHLIDLSQWFLGKFDKVQGVLPKFFWKGEVEDNCFMILSNKSGQCASLHATWTEWKNTFLFELTGEHGKVSINGFGGSYGTETITFYKMLPEMGPPETISWQYPFRDQSWEREMNELVTAIKEDRPPVGGLEETIDTLKIIEQLYRSAK